MSYDAANLILADMRRFDRKIDRVSEDLRDLKGFVTGVEEHLAGVNRRIDRMEDRMDRIEKRLDLVEP